MRLRQPFAGRKGEAKSSRFRLFASFQQNAGYRPLVLQPLAGNVGIGQVNPTYRLQVVNAYCDGNTWSPSSDRALKAGFEPVDAEAVLAKVATLPLTRWHYRNNAATPHLGPVARDFQAAFVLAGSGQRLRLAAEQQRRESNRLVNLKPRSHCHQRPEQRHVHVRSC